MTEWEKIIDGLNPKDKAAAEWALEQIHKDKFLYKLPGT